MSTRSVVAAADGDAWTRGRYVHSDGYPDGVGRTLWTLVARDGVEAVLRVITEEHYGWSNLHASQPDIKGVRVSPKATFGTYEYGSPQQVALVLRKGGMYGDGRFGNVPGYGIAYTTHQGQSNADKWVEFNGDNWGTEWAYALGAGGMLICKTSEWIEGQPETWVPVHYASWDQPQPLWDQLEKDDA